MDYGLGGIIADRAAEIYAAGFYAGTLFGHIRHYKDEAKF